jgi:hypothetical protein
MRKPNAENSFFAEAPPDIDPFAGAKVIKKSKSEKGKEKKLLLPTIFIYVSHLSFTTECTDGTDFCCTVTADGTDFCCAVTAC